MIRKNNQVAFEKEFQMSEELPKWEYLVAILDTDVGVVDDLNVLGAEGWELVQILASGSSYNRFVFKREKLET